MFRPMQCPPAIVLHKKSSSFDDGSISSQTENSSPTIGQEQRIEDGFGMDVDDEVASVGSPRIAMVVCSTPDLERPELSPFPSPTRSVRGCFGLRMGNCVEPTHLERSLEPTGTSTAHQLQGTAGHLEGHPTSATTGFVSQTILRQYDHHIICEQVRRYSISSTAVAGPTDLGVLFEDEPRLHLTYVPSPFNPADPSYFRHLNCKWSPHLVDVFAHHQNHLLPQYISWKHDHVAMAIDALSICWQHLVEFTSVPLGIFFQQSFRKSNENGWTRS
jgi:hypothetical protein